jgi:hypothetical protein
MTDKELRKIMVDTAIKSMHPAELFAIGALAWYNFAIVISFLIEVVL